jgi:protein-disulfide isomerase
MIYYKPATRFAPYLASIVLASNLGVGLAQNAGEPRTAAEVKGMAPCNCQCEAQDSGQSPLTRDQGAAILEELRRIDLLLNASNAPSRNPVADAPTHVRIKIEENWYKLGKDDALAVILEFADLECPFCRRFHAATFPKLKADYIDSGKVRFVVGDLPLPRHLYARDAAEAARCAGAQGKFWDFRDAVLSSKDAPTPEELTAEARKVGLKLDTFEECRKAKVFESAIQTDEDEALKADIRGTPTFVVGRVVDGWLDGTKVSGNRPYATLQAVIEDVLSPTSKIADDKGRKSSQ